MAARLSQDEVAEIVAAVASGGADAAKDPKVLVLALREAKVSAFSVADLDAATAALVQLDRPTEVRMPWPANRSRGLFFVFEGLDRSGKSTQSKLLANRFEELGMPVKWTCFPNRNTTIGTLIDLYLLRKLELHDETVHLLFSANRWEMADGIVTDLNNGVSIICDRYAFSGVAYSAAKGLDFEWCQSPDLGLPTPDGIFYLHLDEKVGASRANFGDERYENAVMQKAVRSEFQRSGLREGVAWNDIDAARDIETIKDEIATVVQVTLKSVESGIAEASPIRRLWMA